MGVGPPSFWAARSRSPLGGRGQDTRAEPEEGGGHLVQEALHAETCQEGAGGLGERPARGRELRHARRRGVPEADGAGRAHPVRTGRRREQVPERVRAAGHPCGSRRTGAPAGPASRCKKVSSTSRISCAPCGLCLPGAHPTIARGRAPASAPSRVLGRAGVTPPRRPGSGRGCRPSSCGGAGSCRGVNSRNRWAAVSLSWHRACRRARGWGAV